MKRKRFLFITIFTLVLFTVCFAAAASLPLSDSDTIESVSSIIIDPAKAEHSREYTLPTPAPPTPAPTEEPRFEEYDITLMALGDNLMHMGIVNTGRREDGTYDYTFLFEPVARFLAAADIKVTNQETILAGNELGFSGFPKFNSPTEVGDAIAAAGFNVVLHATNHAADQGLAGIQSCAAFWEQYPDVLLAGISKDPSASRISYLSIKDITFAILNYTYGPNMEILPSNLMGHLNMLCDYDAATGRINFTALNPQVTEDIREAEEHADIVIVFPHWGTEYQSVPSAYQKKFAAEMTEAGADLIIGAHPHVPQPIEWITAENGNRSLCYYSLGNYVSTQKQIECMLEGMAWVTFHVTETGVSISNENTGVLPLVCHYKSGPTRLVGIYPLEEYTEEMALKHGIWNYGPVPLHLSDLQEQSRETFGQMVLSLADILSGAP